MDIVTIKLTTGEEVIGKLKTTKRLHPVTDNKDYDELMEVLNELKDDDIILNSPRVLMVVQGREPGQIGLQMVPWVFGIDQNSE